MKIITKEEAYFLFYNPIAISFIAIVCLINIIIGFVRGKND